MRHFISASLIGMLALATSVVCSSETLRVPNQYKTIQAAVNAATAGDKIHVEEGVYANETHANPLDPLRPIAGILVDKPDIEIAGEEGAVVDGAAFVGTTAETVGISVQASGVTIRGLAVRNFSGGIVVTGPGGRVQANTVTACATGILVSVHGDNAVPAKTTVDHNSTTGNTNGIVLDFCQNVTVTRNTTNDNSGAGVLLESGTTGCTVKHNESNGNRQYGFFVEFTCSGNTLSLNTAFGNVVFDAEDEGVVIGLPAQNFWDHNKFGSTAGI